MSYNPAVNSTQSAGLTHLASVYYAKRGLDKLYKKLRFQAAAEQDREMPGQSGKTVQFWRGSLPGANTAPSAEGVVGMGLPLVTSTISATVENYSDFTSTSSLLEETAINDMITEASDQMSYRGALSVDNITRAEWDGSGVTIGTTIGGGGFLLPDAKKQVALLQGKDVLGKFDDDTFLGIIHPYSSYDMVADNTAGGFVDVTKYSQPGTALNGEMGMAGGVRWIKTTNVGSDGVAAPNTKYYVYIIGKGAVAAIPLVGRGPNNVIDPSKSRFKLNITKGGPAGFDPAGEIGTFIAYRFVYAAKCLDSTNYRYAIVKADSSII